jgi:hypothetical protein
MVSKILQEYTYQVRIGLLCEVDGIPDRAFRIFEPVYGCYDLFHNEKIWFY